MSALWSYLALVCASPFIGYFGFQFVHRLLVRLHIIHCNICEEA